MITNLTKSLSGFELSMHISSYVPLYQAYGSDGFKADAG